VSTHVRLSNRNAVATCGVSLLPSCDAHVRSELFRPVAYAPLRCFRYVSQPAGRAELEQQKAAISEKLAGAVIPAMSAGKEQMQARVQSGLDKELAEDARESARETTPDGLFTNVMHQQLVTVANGRTAAEGALEQTVKQGHEFEIHEDEKNLAGKMLAHKVAGVKGVEHRDHEFEEQLKKMKSEAEYRVERERKAKAMLAVAGAVPKGIAASPRHPPRLRAWGNSRT
jgi:hypothetical protein